MRGFVWVCHCFCEIVCVCVCVCVSQRQQFTFHIITQGITPMSLRLKRVHHALDQHAPYTNPTPSARAHAHTHTHTHTQTNLCSRMVRRWYTHLGNCRKSWIPPCWCMCVCCRSRRCCSYTRRYLSARVCVGAIVCVRFCVCVATTAMYIPYHTQGITPMSLRLKRVRIMP